MKVGRSWTAVLVALVGGLVLAQTAHAAIAGSSITTPTDPSFFVADNDAASQTFAVSGTTSGGNPAVDRVDIGCYYSNTYKTVASNVLLNADGSFSIPNADLGTIGDRVCRLRAVPAGTSPADPTPFAGPRIGVGERGTDTLSGGLNDGTIYDYYVYALQLTGAFDYASLGDCGIDDGLLFDATLALTTTTFYCNAGLLKAEAPSATRSEIQIDGVDAYASSAAAQIDSAAAGLPALSYSFTVDPSTGDLVIHERDPFVRCTDTTYPPNATKCATFVPTGVTDNRTIVQDHDGHLSTIADAFTSTDGAAHPLDLLWENDQRFQLSSGDATQLEYKFPGEGAFAMHAAGDVVSLPSSPGTILVRMHGAADGDPGTGQGAIVYDRAANVATFTTSSTSHQSFTLHEAGTVPAGGSTTFRFAYAQAYTAAQVSALAAFATDLFGAPTVHIASPANGAVVDTNSVAVSGTAADNVGVSSLTVSGQAVNVAGDGSWSTTVALNAGTNTITAVAQDAAGNTAQDQVTVTYRPSSPPPASSPNTKITKSKISKAKRTAKFSFNGTGGARPYRFECKLTGQSKKLNRWKRCSSPKAYRHLKRGKHVFEVKAIDSAGRADRTPAKKKFKIK